MSARRAVLAPVMALVVLAGAAAGTQASTAPVRLGGTIAAAPVWSGPQALVLIESAHGHGHGYALRTVDPASAATTTSVGVQKLYQQPRLAASQSLVALQGVDSECSDGCKYEDPFFTADDLLAAASGATPQCVAAYATKRGCRAAATVCPEAIQAPLVWATTLVYESCTASGVPFAEALDEPFSAIALGPGGPISRVATIAYPEALAGEWLVGLAPGWSGREIEGGRPNAVPMLVERNLVTGAEPLRLQVRVSRPSPPSLYGEGEYPAIASVQEDGRVVYVTGGRGEGRLWTASPAEPTPRSLGRAVGGTNVSELSSSGPSLIVRNDRIAASEPPRRGVVVEGLDGLPLGSLRAKGLSGFDFDGSRVLVALTPCSESFLATWTVGEPPPTTPGGKCPSPRVTRVSFGVGSIGVALACPASSPLGCPPMDVELNLPGPASPTVELLPGAKRTISLPLGRFAQRLLARRRHMHVKLYLNSFGKAPARSVLVRVP